MAARTHLSIGEVLSLLREEFPDITISKIRFLESQGLVDPERTPSGYRKFYEPDVERLRWILRQQRENFLPLKVIRGRLEDPSADDPDAPPPGGGPVRPPDSGAGDVTPSLFEEPVAARPRPPVAPAPVPAAPAGSALVGAPPVPASPVEAPAAAGVGEPIVGAGSREADAAGTAAPLGSSTGRGAAAPVESAAGRGTAAPGSSVAGSPTEAGRPTALGDRGATAPPTGAAPTSTSTSTDDGPSADVGTAPAGRRGRGGEHVDGGPGPAPASATSHAPPAGPATTSEATAAGQPVGEPGGRRSGEVGDGPAPAAPAGTEPHGEPTAAAPEEAIAPEGAPARASGAPGAVSPPAPAAGAGTATARPPTPVAPSEARAPRGHAEEAAPIEAPPVPATPAPAPTAAAPTVPGRRNGRPAADDEVDSYTLAELARAARSTESEVAALRDYGLIVPDGGAGGTAYYGPDALAVVEVAATFARHGVEARHLRAWKTGADREAGLFEQVVVPLLRQRNPGARRQAADTVGELAEAGGRLRELLVRRATRDLG